MQHIKRTLSYNEKMNSSPYKKQKIGVVRTIKPQYPKEAPFHPYVNYVEYPFGGYISNEINYVYDGLRQLFFKLGFDIEHWNTPNWNPLGYLIKPGMTVVIKPNLVLSKHVEGKDIYTVITHPSILRAIVDYCWIALKGKGKIIIADSPHFNCNFKELLKVTKLEEVKDFINRFSGPRIEIYDLRDHWLQTQHFPFRLHELSGDPYGCTLINLGKNSAFYNHQNQKNFYGGVYISNKCMHHHIGEKQEYEISKTILSADVIISVPKMKVHKKVGVTLNLKGLVGTCTNKNSSIHYTLGTPSEGGDQFPENLFNKKERLIIKFKQRMFEWIYDYFSGKRAIKHKFFYHFICSFLFLKIIRHFQLDIPQEKELFVAGNWSGNDSTWRTVVDLAKIIYFADKEGGLHDRPQRQLFSIIDGIIGGENKGPDVPDPKPIGVLIGGENFLAVDIVTTRLMGFDPLKLKQFSILNDSYYDFGLKILDEIEVISDEPAIQKCLENKKDKLFAFKPYPGWIGNIEI